MSAVADPTFQQTRTYREATQDDISKLPPFQRKIFNILDRNRNQFVDSNTLKFETGTKHAPRRVSEIQAAGFCVEVRKNGSRNEYRFTGEVRA